MLNPVAIVGIGCRLPGADGPAALWNLLRQGREAISPVPTDRWDSSDSSQPEPAGHRRGGFLRDIDRFDPGFFGIAVEECRAMDPQQRLLLEVAWECFEDAAIVPKTLAGSEVGVFVGLSSLNYSVIAQKRPETIGRFTNIGSGGSVAANRISYFFDLHGPSCMVDTACASSLTAVHLACQSIWRGECIAALAGGVNVILSPVASVSMSRNGMLSAGGTCRVFDADADGTVRGEGAALVLLKPLDRALADRDPIYAVIRSTAVNHNGRSNGISGPSRSAQEALLALACRQAQVEPRQIQYVEAHSVGSPIGDAMELAALANVIGANRRHPCAIGSIKTNMGHLEAAAGIAGLIKTALMLRHRQLAPALHFQRFHPHARINPGRLRVQTVAQPWPRDEGERLAGVSAAGFAGANAHVILAEPPDVETASAPESPLHLTLSARTPAALRILAERYAVDLGERIDASAGDICGTANRGRTAMTHRAAFSASDREHLIRQLKEFASGTAPAPTDSRLGSTEGDFRRVHGLPTYPFERQRFWLDDAPQAASAPAPEIVSESAPMPGRNPRERRLVAIWERLLETAPVGIRDNFFEIGGTSVQALQLFAAIEKEFGIVLPPSQLYAHPTVEQLGALLDAPEEQSRWETLVGLNENGSRTPLFFVPGLGGHAFDLHVLAKRIGADQPIYVLHPQGLNPREVPLTNIQDMAAAFLKHVRTVSPDGPYQFGGYSFGGSVAFEMACQARQAGAAVDLLALLDAYAPEAFRRRSMAVRLVRHAKRMWGLERRSRRKYLTDRLRRVLGRFRGEEAPRPNGPATLIDAVQRVTDANHLAWRRYRPGRFSGDAILFRARPREESIRMFCHSDPTNGWSFHVDGSLQVVELTGDHLQLFEGDALDFLAARLGDRLSPRERPDPPVRRAG